MVDVNLKGYSIRNILTLLCGNLGAQLVTFLVGLVLARRYTPEDFGILGVFLAISNILIPISCLGYEAAIVISKDIKEAVSVSLLCLCICIGFSVLLFLPIVICKETLVKFFNCPGIYPWIYILPLSVILGGSFNILNYFNTKIKEYKAISLSNIVKSITCALLQVLVSFFRGGPFGLILGQTSMNLFGNIRLCKNIFKYKIHVSLNDLKSVGIRYSKFPKFYFWGVMSNNISLNVTNILIKKLYSTSDVGFYSYAYKYIGFPISLIASSAGQVYYQELSEIKNNVKKVKQVFRDTFVKLLVLGIPIFSTMYLLVEPGFIFLFGDKWESAGEMGQILIPLFFIRFVTSPLSMTLLAFEKQNLLLRWQIFLMLCTFLPFVVISFLGCDIITYLYMEVACLSFGYILYLISIYCVIRHLK